MPSTYTLNNGIELIGTGEQSGTWGDTTNLNLELLDTALDGQVTVTLSSTGSGGSPNTLPISDGSSSNGRNRLVVFNDGSDIGGTVYVQLTPNDAEKIIYVRNSLSGSRSILLFQGTYNASNDYEIPAGTTAIVFFNGGGTGAVAANVFNNAYFDGLRLGSVSVTAILDEDNMASNSATALSTQQSIKAYVDSQVTAQDLDFGGDSGTGAVDLDSQTFTIAGTTNEIETSASGQTLTVGLPDNVTIAGDLTVDTDTLYVDSTNDRVGINKDAPSVPLHIDIGTDNNAIYIESSDQFANIGLVDGSGSGKIIMDGGDLLLTSGGDGTTSFTGSAEAMRVDSSQRVLINTNTSRVVGGSAQAVTQIYNTSNGALLSLFRDQASNNGGAIIRGGKARNGAIVQDNDTIFSFEAVAHDGTDMGSFAGTIAFQVDGTPGANDTPSRITFYTTADGSASGSERMRINNAGKVRIGSGDPSLNLEVIGSGDQFIFLQTTDTSDGVYIKADSGGDGVEFQTAGGQNQFGFRTNGTLAATIDSSQRVLIGTISSRTVQGFNHKLQIEGTDASTASISITRNSNSIDPPYITFGKSRSGSVGGSGIIQENDVLGRLDFTGANGSNLNEIGVRIDAHVDGDPTGSTDMPGRIVFQTSADGGASPTERMRINSAGDVKIGSAGTPETKLQVQGGSIENGTILMGANYNGTGMNQNSEKSGAIHHPVYVSTTSPKGYRLIGGYADSTRNMVQIGGGTNSAKAATQIVLYTGASATASSNTEAMRIDSGQRVLIGHTSSIPNGGDSQRLQVTGVGSSDGISLARFNTDFGAYFTIGRSGSGTIGTYTAVPNNDEIGRIQWAVADGTDMSSVGAMINAVTEELAASNDVPTRLVFSTTANGSQSPTERMRLDSSGQLTLNSNRLQINAGDSGSNHIRLRRGVSPTFATFFADIGYVLNGNGTSEALRLGTGSSSDAIQFYLGDGNLDFVFESDPQFQIRGDVSINSNSPSVRGNIIIADSGGSESGAGGLEFHSSSGGGGGYGARISADSGGNIYNMVRSNSSSWTRITRVEPSGSAGVFKISTDTFTTTAHLGMSLNAVGTAAIRFTVSNNEAWTFDNRNGSGTYQIDFRWNNVESGRIDVNSSAVAYQTSSDYRLKENLADITDGIDTVKQLQPKRYNFIANSDHTETGFIAHEIKDVLGHVVSGEKDATVDVGDIRDANGDLVKESCQQPSVLEEGQTWTYIQTVPKYQQLDYARLTPILTAALKEAVAKIEALEARVAALETP